MGQKVKDQVTKTVHAWVFGLLSVLACGFFYSFMSNFCEG